MATEKASERTIRGLLSDATLLRNFMRSNAHVEDGAKIDAKDIVDEATPLMLAAGLGHLEIVKFLVEHGADINAYDSNGDRVFHAAEMSAALVNWVEKGEASNTLFASTTSAILRRD
ncbi:unnamed protein product [Clonostachys byssicola]|uniref:Uncharacterized protein n=1 Tax=Clonostachys byssicola TaxID=160290 RepID=A0A9N9UBV9_9HYPO|nr:unnamed protein product [Clonostachys byssicola]